MGAPSCPAILSCLHVATPFLPLYRCIVLSNQHARRQGNGRSSRLCGLAAMGSGRSSGLHKHAGMACGLEMRHDSESESQFRAWRPGWRSSPEHKSRALGALQAKAVSLESLCAIGMEGIPQPQGSALPPQLPPLPLARPPLQPQVLLPSCRSSPSSQPWLGIYEMRLIALALRACLLVSLTAASAAWLRWVQRRVPPGPARFIAAAPVMATYLLAPLLFDTATEVAAVVGSINLPWLSNTVVSFGASHAACTALA